MLIELLDREGLIINTRKSSIERLDATKSEEEGIRQKKVRSEKIATQGFRIFAGYGGMIPIKFRIPTEHSRVKYLAINLASSIDTIRANDFARRKNSGTY